MTEQTLVKMGEILPAAPGDGPVIAYLASLRSDASRRTMRQALEKVAELAGHTLQDMPWEKLEAGHLEALGARLARDHSPATANKCLSAVKGVMRRVWRDFHMIDAEHYMRIKDVEGIPNKRLPVGREISPGEIVAMARVCSEDQTSVGARDAAILAVAAVGGLRRAEIAGLELEDLQDDGSQIMIRLVGKGDKEREVPVDNGGADALRDWLHIRGNSPGALFWSGRKGGRINRGAGMSAQAIYDVLLRRAAQAGVAKLSPHDFRRTVIGDLLDAGADAVTVARLVGHSSTDTTMRYDRRGKRAMKKAASLLHFPYQRRAVLA